MQLLASPSLSAPSPATGPAGSESPKDPIPNTVGDGPGFADTLLKVTAGVSEVQVAAVPAAVPVSDPDAPQARAAAIGSARPELPTGAMVISETETVFSGAKTSPDGSLAQGAPPTKAPPREMQGSMVPAVARPATAGGSYDLSANALVEEGGSVPASAEKPVLRPEPPQRFIPEGRTVKRSVQAQDIGSPRPDTPAATGPEENPTSGSLKVQKQVAPALASEAQPAVPGSGPHDRTAPQTDPDRARALPIVPVQSDAPAAHPSGGVTGGVKTDQPRQAVGRVPTATGSIVVSEEKAVGPASGLGNAVPSPAASTDVRSIASPRAERGAAPSILAADATEQADRWTSPGLVQAVPLNATVSKLTSGKENIILPAQTDVAGPLQTAGFERFAAEPLALEARGGDAKMVADMATPRADTPRPAMSQLAELARRLPGGPIEVSLSPEELGRVRLSMQPAEGGMVVQIAAERSETLDLIRRNIDLLAQELRDQGYAELRFAFGDAQTGENEGHPGPERPEEIAMPPEQEAIAAAPRLSVAAGLDIRM